jgi:hypothetical protein
LISLLAVTLILSQLHATINTLLVFLRQARKVVGSLLIKSTQDLTLMPKIETCCKYSF